MSANAFRAKGVGKRTNRIKNDFYQTPQDVADKCVELLTREIEYTTMNILDIGSGYGVFGEALAKYNSDYYLDGVDVENEIKNPDKYSNFYKMDILDYIPNKNYDLIVGNPPYGRMNEKILKYVINIVRPRYLAWLLPSTYIHGQRRYNLVGKHLKSYFVFVNRIDFTNSGNPIDNSAFFIYDFYKEYDVTQMSFV